MAWLDAAAEGVARHWLAILNSLLGLFVTLPWLAPLFMALGWQGAGGLLNRIYAGFCHQLPERSYFIFGYQVAHCHRCVFFYGGIFVAGLLYARARPRLLHNDGRGLINYTALAIPTAVLLCLPMLVDTVTHIVGLRNGGWGGDQLGSLNWWLRLATGLPAAFALVFAAYPRIDAGFARSLAYTAYYRAAEQVPVDGGNHND